MNDAFHVVYLPAALAQFREIFEHANAKGAGRLVLEAGKEIHRRLCSDPIAFGDPLYDLHYIQLRVFGRAVSPLIVTFGVHEAEGVVFVGRFEAMPEPWHMFD